MSKDQNKQNTEKTNEKSTQFLLQFIVAQFQLPEGNIDNFVSMFCGNLLGNLNCVFKQF